MKELHIDQQKVVIALLKPWEFWESDDNMGIRGVTVEQLIHGTQLSKEKVLLSLGRLEDQKIVAHDMGIVRKVIDYFGHSNVTIPGTQMAVRLFFLTKKGRDVGKSLEEEK